MEQVKLGTLDVGEHRDAVHVAILPVVAGEKLYPGQHVGFVDDGKQIVGTKTERHVGIVDPFLPGTVFPESRFYLLLYPNTVLSLRHQWEHPEVDGVGVPIAPDKEKAKAVIAAFAADAGLSFEEVIMDAHKFIESGEYRVDGGRWEGTWAGEDFWDAFEVLTGKKVPDVRRGGIYSCSC